MCSGDKGAVEAALVGIASLATGSANSSGDAVIDAAAIRSRTPSMRLLLATLTRGRSMLIFSTTGATVSLCSAGRAISRDAITGAAVGAIDGALANCGFPLTIANACAGALASVAVIACGCGTAGVEC